MVPAVRAPEPAGSALEPGERALEPAEGALRSQLGGPLKPAGRPGAARRASWELGGDGDRETERTERSWYMVVP